MRTPAAKALEKFDIGAATKSRITNKTSLRMGLSSLYGLPLSSMRAPAAQAGSGIVVEASRQKTERARIRARMGVLENETHHMR